MTLNKIYQNIKNIILRGYISLGLNLPTAGLPEENSRSFRFCNTYNKKEGKFWKLTSLDISEVNTVWTWGDKRPPDFQNSSKKIISHGLRVIKV